MTNPRGRKRSAISTVLAVFVVMATLVTLAVVKVNSFFRRKYVPIEQLKFPVLVVQPGGVALFAEWDSVALQKFSEHSSRTPVNGTVIIDSEFNQFTQENVERKKEGDLKWMARFLLPGLRVKYTFDLRRGKASGREAMMELIRRAPPFTEDAAEDASMRQAAQQQSTMAGVLDALHFHKPVEPVTQPSSELETALDPQPTTEESEDEVAPIQPTVVPAPDAPSEP